VNWTAQFRAAQQSRRLRKCDSGFVAVFTDGDCAAAMCRTRVDFAGDFLAMDREFPRTATANELAFDPTSVMATASSASFLRYCVYRFHFFLSCFLDLSVNAKSPADMAELFAVESFAFTAKKRAFGGPLRHTSDTRIVPVFGVGAIIFLLAVQELAAHFPQRIYR
jgi:hypothetical protein